MIRKFPYEPGRIAATIFRVRTMENPQKAREIPVAYNEKVHDICWTDRFIVDGEMYFISGGGGQYYSDLDLHFQIINLVPREWHEDNMRAQREYASRVNPGRALRQKFGQPHEPLVEVKTDIGQVHNIEDFF